MKPGQINIRFATAADNVLLAEMGARTFYDAFAADNTPEDMAVYLAASFSPEKQAAELNEFKLQNQNKCANILPF